MTAQRAPKLDEETTIRRRVPLGAAVSKSYKPCRTVRQPRIDERTLAIARGEREPEEEADPFGGLIPVEDEDVIEEIDEEWLIVEPTDIESEMAARDVVPRLLMESAALARLPIDHRSGFVLSLIDGQRNLGEILDICCLAEADARRVLAQLVKLGAIEHAIVVR